MGKKIKFMGNDSPTKWPTPPAAGHQSNPYGLPYEIQIGTD